MRKKIIILLFIIISYMSLTFANPNLFSVHSDSINSGFYGDYSVQYITTDEGLQISVSADFSDSGDYVKYYFNIQNKTNKTYHFDEKSIVAYEGNFQNGTWYNLPYKTATQFYTDRKNDLTFGSVLLGVLALGALFSSDIDFEVNIATPLSFFLPSIHVSLFDPDPLLEGLALANLFYLIDVADDINSLEYLEHSLLYSTKINPNEEYTGVIFVPEGKGPDYKVVFNVNKHEKYDFTFARSDRNSILNPWADKDFMVAVMAGFPVPTINGFSLFSIISGKIFGGYFGSSFFSDDLDSKETCAVAFKNDFNNISIKDNSLYSSKYDFRFVNPTTHAEDVFGMYGGLTTKIVPHIYLMSGIGVEFAKRLEYGTFQRKIKNDENALYNDYINGWIEVDPVIYCVPQLGVNISFGHFDFATIFDYRINDRFRFNVLFGASF